MDIGVGRLFRREIYLDRPASPSLEGTVARRVGKDAECRRADEEIVLLTSPSCSDPSEDVVRSGCEA